MDQRDYNNYQANINNQQYAQYAHHGFPVRPQPQAQPQHVNVIMLPETSGMAVTIEVLKDKLCLTHYQ